MVSFYKHDIAGWRGGTASLTHEQYRVYHVIIEQVMLDEGPTRVHERMYAGLANLSVRAFNRTLGELIAIGKLIRDGDRVTNVRAENELISIRNNRVNAKTGGISSGKARREGSNATEKPSKINGAAEAPLPSAMKPKREEKRREERREERVSPLPPSNGGGEDHDKSRRADEEAAIQAAFERFWTVYPKRDGSNPRKPAADSFLKAVKGGASPEVIIRGARAYAVQVDRGGKAKTTFVAQAVTWLNQQRWLDEYEPTGPPERYHMV